MRQGERERGREGGGSEGGTREAPAIVKVWLRGKGRKICRGVRGREGMGKVRQPYEGLGGNGMYRGHVEVDDLFANILT